MTTTTLSPTRPGADSQTAWSAELQTSDAHPSETVWELFARRAQEHPVRTALVDGGTEVDYGRLAQRALAIAEALATRGVPPRSQVAVCVHRSWELVATLMGILRAGCAYVPLDPAYPEERNRTLLEQARPLAAVVDRDGLGRLRGEVPEIVQLESVGQPTASAGAAGRSEGPGPRDLAYVLFTSGSTGRPKGIAVEHRNVVAFCRSMRTLLDDDELSGVSATASICFDASVMEILGTLCLGGTMILADNVLELPETSAAARVKTLILVPSAMKALLAAGPLPPGVRCVVLGAEVLTRSLVDRLRAEKPDLRVINVYGPTEDTVFSTTAEIATGPEKITIGRSVAGSRSYVLDDALQPVPTGVEGELYLAGDQLSRGYLFDEERTRERFLQLDGGGAVPETRLYRTGDWCRRNESGDLEFLGRIDHQVKIRGHRIELEEIEAALEAMPGVESAAVAAVAAVDPGSTSGGDSKVLVAYVVSPNGAVTAEAARAYLAQHLPGYMVPQGVILLDALPRLPNGKLDRRALPRPEDLGPRPKNLARQQGFCADDSAVRERSSASPARETRRDALLTTIRTEIGSMLRLDDPTQIPAQELLEDLGLDSLTKVELGSRLGAILDRKLPVSALLEHSTPAALADYLLGLTTEGAAASAEDPARGPAADTLGSFQTQIAGCYPPFLAGKAPAWSATDKGVLVHELKQLVSRPGDPFCKLVRTGSGHRGIVADVDTDRAREAIIWTTNLYLGLNRHPEVIAEARAALERFGTGMGTSAAASGITDVHLEFEKEFADLVGKSGACLFPTGYTANVGAVAGLLGNHDVIVMDQLCHASIVDGARLCGATIRTFQHNDPADLEKVLATEASPYRTVLVVLEGVYSMGEGTAPVLEIARTAKRYGALVLVDEAHSFGFYGPRGAGICAAQGATDEVDFIMTTLSKALGSLGGVVAAREEHVALLKSSSRAFIFQASTSPADIAAALAALRRLRDDDSLRERLWDTTAYMRRRFTEAGYDLGTGDGPIVTPHFFDKDELFAIVNGLFERGVHTSAVTYPVVESGRGRLRFICSAAHSRDDVDTTLAALIEAEREAKLERPAEREDGDEAPLERASLKTWAEGFATYLRGVLPKTSGEGPSLAVTVDLAEDADPIVLLIEGQEVAMAERVPVGTPRCSLQLESPRAVEGLRTADVQELLAAMLDGRCRLSGQVEPFVWLIGRLAEQQRSVAS